MSKHPIVHVEIPAADPKAGGDFYHRLFGWELDYDEKMDYMQFNPGEGPAGGFPAVSENNPAGQVTVYVGTDDIEASLSKAESLGAKVIMPKTEIPTIGWFAIFADPTGNPIALYKSMQS